MASRLRTGVLLQRLYSPMFSGAGFALAHLACSTWSSWKDCRASQDADTGLYGPRLSPNPLPRAKGLLCFLEFPFDSIPPIAVERNFGTRERDSFVRAGLLPQLNSC